jgi:hypothetical protein
MSPLPDLLLAIWLEKLLRKVHVVGLLDNKTTVATQTITWLAKQQIIKGNELCDSHYKKL